MISDDLFNKILIEPAVNCNQLNIISGYASPSMANKHLTKLKEKVEVNLIVGMTPSDGIGLGCNFGFKSLEKESDFFNCRYVVKPHQSVHIKSYIWLRDGKPYCAFTGSGNYSQNAFFDGTMESFCEDDPSDCNSIFTRIHSHTISCLDQNLEDKINIYEEIYHRPALESDLMGDVTLDQTLCKVSNNSVTLSLLSTRTGETHESSGLNWGQRKGREPNQAYIPIPTIIAGSSFFPNRAKHFTLITDDGKSFDCVVAQDGDKAIHSTQNNSLLGMYFRQRIGLSLGDYVSKHNLLHYGRTDVVIYKIDDETFYMDFSI